MEDIGNIIYYVVIFVIALISWLSSPKKKKQQQTSIPSPFPTHEMQTTPPPVPNRKRKAAPPPVPKAQLYTSAQSSLSSKYINDTFTEPEEEPTLIEELDLTNMESFRKAVIYTEILNRKY